MAAKIIDQDHETASSSEPGELLTYIQSAQVKAISELRVHLAKVVKACKKTEKRILDNLEIIFNEWNEVTQQSIDKCSEVQDWISEFIDWLRIWLREMEVKKQELNLEEWLQSLNIPESDFEKIIAEFKIQGIMTPSDLLHSRSYWREQFGGQGNLNITMTTSLKLLAAMEKLTSHGEEIQKCLDKLIATIERGVNLFGPMKDIETRFQQLANKLQQMIQEETKHAKKCAYVAIGVAVIGVLTSCALIGSCIALSVCCGVGVLEAVVVIPVAITLAGTAVTTARLCYESYTILDGMTKSSKHFAKILAGASVAVDDQKLASSASNQALKKLLEKTTRSKDSIDTSQDLEVVKLKVHGLIKHYERTAESFRNFESILQTEMRCNLYTSYMELRQAQVSMGSKRECIIT